MITQLLLGSVLVCLSVFLTVIFMSVGSIGLTRLGEWLVAGNPFLKLSVSLSGVVLWLLAGLSASVWVWAGAFLGLGLFDTLEESLYFSVVSFTTLGFGDVVIGKEWRLLSGIIAANGLILFSLNTAFLIEFVSRLHDVREADG